MTAEELEEAQEGAMCPDDCETEARGWGCSVEGGECAPYTLD